MMGFLAPGECEHAERRNSLKIKYVMIPMPALLEFLQTGNKHVRCAKGLPDDAIFLRAGHDEMGNLYMVFQSEEWPELEVGNRMQEFCPYFEKLG